MAKTITEMKIFIVSDEEWESNPMGINQFFDFCKSQIANHDGTYCTDEEVEKFFDEYYYGFDSDTEEVEAREILTPILKSVKEITNIEEALVVIKIFGFDIKSYNCY